MKPRYLLRNWLLLATVTVTSAQGETLYWGGGTSNISDGTVIPSSLVSLNGTWSNTLENWSTSRTSTDFGTWSTGSIANLGYFTDAAGSATLTVDGNKTISGMMASLTAATSTNRLFQLNGAAADTTLTLTGSSARFLISATSSTNGVVIGANNAAGTQLTLGASSTTLVKDGAGTLTLGNGFSTSSNAFTGAVLVRSGIFNVASGTSFNGTTTFDVRGYRPNITTTNAGGNEAFTAPTLQLNLATVAGTSDRISDSANITLANRGTLELRSGHATGVENIGGLVLNGTGFILNSQGTAGQTVNLGTLSRGTDGRGTAVVSVTSSDVLNHNIRITNTTGLTTDTLLPWLSTNRAEWLMIDSTNNNQLTRVASTTASLDAATWGSYVGTDNLRINGVMTNTLGADLAINSLGFLGTGTASNLNLGNRTLTVNAGAIGLSPSGNVAYNISNGTVRTGEVSPGVNRDLYINTGNSNTSSLVLDSVLTGTMDIYVTGQSPVFFGPSTAAAGTANTYTGTVYVNSGTLNVNKDAGVTGNVVVASGGGLVLNRAAGLAATSNITLGRDALFSAGSSAATLNGIVTSNGGQILIANNSGGLTFGGSGTGFAFNGGIVTHNSGSAGRINLATNVGYAATSETQAVFQRVNTAGAFAIHLNNGASSGNAERTFNIANSTTLAAGKSEMLVDAPIANGGTGSATGSIRKTGDGVLELTATNTFTGGLTIDGGTVKVGRIQAAAQTGLTGTFTNAGIEGHTLTFATPITGTMAVGQAVTGTNIAASRTIAAILNDYQVILNGTVGISGTTNANQAQTNIALGAVDRIGSIDSAVTVNDNGTLLLDTGTSVNNTVTVNLGGVLAGSGTITGATAIAGSLRPGQSIGTMTVNNTVTWNSSTDPGDAWRFELGLAAADLASADAGGSTQDLLAITAGDFSMGTTGGDWVFDFAGTGAVGWYKLVDWTGTTGFIDDDFTASNLASGLTGTFEVDSGTSALYLNVVVIPEPRAALLGGLGLLALLRRRRAEDMLKHELRRSSPRRRRSQGFSRSFLRPRGRHAKA